MKKILLNIILSICIVFTISSTAITIYGYINTKSYIDENFLEPVSSASTYEGTYIAKYNLRMKDTANFMGIKIWNYNYLNQVIRISFIGGIVVGLVYSVIQYYYDKRSKSDTLKKMFLKTIIVICIAFTILNIIINATVLIIANIKVGKEVEPSNYYLETIEVKDGDTVQNMYMRTLYNGKIKSMYSNGIILVISIIIGIISYAIKLKQEKDK